MTINTRNEHKPKHERKLTKPSVPLKNQFNTWLGWSRTVLIFSALKNLIYNRQNQGKPNISVGVNIFLKSYKTKKVLLFHFTPRASKINIYIYNKNVKTIVFFFKKKIVIDPYATLSNVVLQCIWKDVGKIKLLHIFFKTTKW